MRDRSKELFEKAQKLFPGGVNSPVRAAVKPYPFYVERAEGPYLYTVDGVRLLDYVLGYGPLILGHRHPRVLRAIVEQAEKGWLYGTPAEAEVKLAEKILGYVKPGGMIRFVNSGTEAVMTAIRLARAYTKREYIVKFEGCYHGASDAVLVGAGSAAAEFGVPKSEGIPESYAKLTLVARYNDIEGFEKLMSKHGDKVAAVIVEPVVGNSGLVPATREFIKALREETEKHQSLLIFDEVITGFRLGLKGAQGYYGVEADIVTLGKIIGGGLPIGAVAGSKEIMENLTPKGKTFNAGTFNAHPLAMAAGLATIEAIEEGGVYETANRAAERIAKALEDYASRAGLDNYVAHVASMAQIFFTKGEVLDPVEAKKSDTKLYVRLHELLLERGVFIAPSQFEVIFTSSAHNDLVVDETIAALEDSFKKLGAERK